MVTKAGLIQALTIQQKNPSYAKAHQRAVELLLKYINDPEVTAAYEAIETQ